MADGPDDGRHPYQQGKGDDNEDYESVFIHSLQIYPSRAGRVSTVRPGNVNGEAKFADNE